MLKGQLAAVFCAPIPWQKLFSLVLSASAGQSVKHCANEGRKIDLLRADPRVGFEMDGAHGLREGQTPCAYSYFYESVVGSGEITFLKDAAEKARALERILLHQAGRKISVSPEQGEAVTVLRLRPDALSCKRNP